MTENVETKKTEEVKSQADASGTGAAQQSSGSDLNISDLLAVKSIIDIASQRGAFKANEMEAVGKTYNRINTFLETVSKKDA
jgi:hypothetical protein